MVVDKARLGLFILCAALCGCASGGKKESSTASQPVKVPVQVEAHIQSQGKDVPVVAAHKNVSETSELSYGPVRRVLPNGLTVVLEESHQAKVVAFQVWVKVGSADESDDEAGI